jgi:serine/threonine protein kinase
MLAGGPDAQHDAPLAPTPVRIKGRLYWPTEVLPSGDNALVCAARDEAGRRVVLKCAASKWDKAQAADEEDEAAFADECRITCALRHPHLMRAIDSGCDVRSGRRYLVLRHVRGEPLSAAIGAANELDVARYLTQALQVCAYLIARRVAHCDLKPSNMLIAGRRLKVGDFGVATRHGAPPKGMSLAFAAPEHLYAARPAPAHAGTDLYSVGVSFYWLLTGVHPYCAGGHLADLSAACFARRPLAPSILNRTIDSGWDDVLLGLIDRAPARRLRAAARVLGR